jgi:hypothetical protein
VIYYLALTKFNKITLNRVQLTEETIGQIMLSLRILLANNVKLKTLVRCENWICQCRTLFLRKKGESPGLKCITHDHVSTFILQKIVGKERTHQLKVGLPQHMHDPNICMTTYQKPYEMASTPVGEMSLAI